jgi:hypothetical protein
MSGLDPVYFIIDNQKYCLYDQKSFEVLMSSIDSNNLYRIDGNGMKHSISTLEDIKNDKSSPQIYQMNKQKCCCKCTKYDKLLYYCALVACMNYVTCGYCEIFQ